MASHNRGPAAGRARRRQPSTVPHARRGPAVPAVLPGQLRAPGHARSGGRPVNENTSYAQALARHVKAALLHLRQAEKIAEVAGTDLDTSEHDVPEAGLFRAAGDAGQDLDLWASC